MAPVTAFLLLTHICPADDLETKTKYSPGNVVTFSNAEGSPIRGMVIGQSRFNGVYKYKMRLADNSNEENVVHDRVISMAPAIERYGFDDILFVKQSDGQWQLARMSGMSGGQLHIEYTVSNIDGGDEYKVAYTDVVKATEKQVKDLKPSKTVAKKLPAEIVAEVNKARTDPIAYAKRIKELSKLDGLFTVDPVKKKVAVDFLTAMTAVGELQSADKLSKASYDFASDTGKINGPEHLGSDGRTAFDRMGKYGSGGMGECLSASKISAFAYVAGFLMSPGHRDILVNGDSTHIGVGCHFHDKDKYIRCVINTAKEWKNK